MKRFLFSKWCILAGQLRLVALRQAFPPESHIPARRAGQYTGMWMSDSGLKEAHCTVWEMKYSHGWGMSSRLKPNPIFHDPPPPLQWWQQRLAPTAIVVLFIMFLFCFGFFLTVPPQRCARHWWLNLCSCCDVGWLSSVKWRSPFFQMTSVNL